jgi:hypothetical protein
VIVSRVFRKQLRIQIVQVEVVRTADAVDFERVAGDTTHSVLVTEVVGGAAAEVRLYDSTHKQIATYRLTGSGSSATSVGAARGDVVTSFIFGSVLRRSRSADAARGIGQDIAVSIASDIAPASDASSGWCAQHSN